MLSLWVSAWPQATTPRRQTIASCHRPAASARRGAGSTSRPRLDPPRRPSLAGRRLLSTEHARRLSTRFRLIEDRKFRWSVVKQCPGWSMITPRGIPAMSTDGERGKGGAAFAPFHAQLGPLQVTMARFYGVRVVDTGCFECMYPFLSNTTRILIYPYTRY